MKINEVIQKIKQYHSPRDSKGQVIDEQTTRDKVLYGDVFQECHGIVTTCFASSEVIREAAQLGCNLIICHEALFWNHGDHTDWLSDNEVFQKKKQLLDETKMVVWRDHDYIHAGIPLEDGTYADGIFYGLMNELGWNNYIEGDYRRSMTYYFPNGIKAKDLAQELVSKMKLNGTRIIGNPQTILHRVMIPMHCIGQFDNDVIKHVSDNQVDGLIAMEMTDFTVSEFIRDSAQLNLDKAAIMIGHFNVEEPGMKYMLRWLPQAIGVELPIFFVQSGDGYQYI